MCIRDRLSLVNVQIGNPRLRDGSQALLLGFAAEVFRNKSFGHIVLQTLAEALLNDGGRYVPGAKARQPRTLLIAHNLEFGFARNFRRRNLHRNLALGVFLTRFLRCV